MPLKLSTDEQFIPVRRRIRRENLKDSDFQSGERVAGEQAYLSKYVVWHPWRLAISPSRPKKQRKRWRRRKNGIGYFKRYLYKLITDKYSLYEVGVMVPKCKEIIVVYYKFIRFGIGPRKSIYKLLLKNNEVIAEVNNIVKRQGAIWFRRGYLNINGELMFSFIREYVRLNFSYPWRSHDPTTGVNRFLKKGKGFLISGNLFLQSPSGSVVSLKKSPSAEAARQQQLSNLNSHPSTSAAEEIPPRKSETGTVENHSTKSDYDVNENAPTLTANYNASSCAAAKENKPCPPNETDIKEFPPQRGSLWEEDGKMTARSDSQDTTELSYNVEKIHIGPTFRSYVDVPYSWSFLNVYTPSSASLMTADSLSSRSSVNMNASTTSFSMNASNSSFNINHSKSTLNVDASISTLNMNTSKSSLNMNCSKSSLNTNTSKSSLNMNTSKSSLNMKASKSTMNMDSSNSVLNTDTSKLSVNRIASKPRLNKKASKMPLKTKASLNPNASNLSMKTNASKSLLNPDVSKASLKLKVSSKSSLKAAHRPAQNVNISNHAPLNVDLYFKRDISKRTATDKGKTLVKLAPIRKQENVFIKSNYQPTNKSRSISNGQTMAKASKENDRLTSVTKSKVEVTLIKKPTDGKESAVSVSVSKNKEGKVTKVTPRPVREMPSPSTNDYSRNAYKEKMDRTCRPVNTIPRVSVSSKRDEKVYKKATPKPSIKKIKKYSY